MWKPLVGKRWVSAIIVGESVSQLGSFANEEEAARAYDKAAREIFGQSAYLNFPEEHSHVRS